MKSLRQRILFFTFLLFSMQNAFSQEAAFDWVKKADFQGGKLEGAVTFSIGLNRYVCLGNDGTNYKKELWVFNYENDSWKRLSDFPGEPRKYAVAFTVGDKAYVGCGEILLNNSPVAKKDFYMYNPAKDYWSKIEDLPGDARSSAIAFTIGDKGYVALGQSIGKTSFCTDIYEYNPSASQWTPKAMFPDKGRADASVFVISGSAYVMLGKQSGDLFKPTKKSAFEYNPKKDKWTPIADFPGTPRIEAISFSVNGKGYIGAGVSGVSKKEKDIWEYDHKKNTWEQKADATFSARQSSFFFVVENRIYVGGGVTKTETLGVGTANDFWCGTAKPVKVYVPYNAKLMYEDKNKKQPLSDQGVSLIGSEKKVIQKTKTDKSGLFIFKEVDAAGNYELVLDKNDKLPADAVVEIAKPSGKVIQNLKRNEDGLFSYEIPTLVETDEDDSYFGLKDFVASSNKDITITSNIYYPQGSADISKEAQDILYMVIVSLNQFPELNVEISSHTDSRGEDAANMLLSEKRAKAAVDYIISYGIDPKRIKGIGYGETKILNKCKNGVECTEEEHKKNRRTELKFIKTT